MTRSECILLCAAEEKAFYHGKGSTHLGGRWSEESLPWDFQEMLRSRLTGRSVFLDLGSGSCSFLLSLDPTPGLAFYAEEDEEAAAILRQRFRPYGVEVRQVFDRRDLPFSDGKFDLVYTRNGDFCPEEVCRILKRGGLFLTQQSGGVDGRFSGEAFPGWEETARPDDLNGAITRLENAGFLVRKGQEAYPELRLRDVGALVYWIHAAGWQPLDFSVEKHEEAFWQLQQRLDEKGFLACREHRFVVEAQKV